VNKEWPFYNSLSIIYTLIFTERYHEGKETSSSRITATSSSKEMSMDDISGIEEGRRYSARPHPFLQQASGQIFKDDVNGFSSTSHMCFIVSMHISCILK
jgi:hypothetical protein